MSRQHTVYVNEAFRPQRVSGQQRYAREISDRLPAEFVRVVPGAFWSRSSLLTWLWTLAILPLRTWRGTLISMTARAPWWHPRHVLVVHDLFVIEHPEWFSRKYYLTHAPLLKFQLRTARGLVAVSEPVAEQVRALRPDVEVTVAPNAPSDVFFAPRSNDDEVLAKHGLTDDGYLVVVGNLEPRKNLARLAEAYGRLSAAERSTMPLVIVGGGAAIYGETGTIWPEGVILTGYVEDSDLAALYAHSRAVVFPSLAEGFGLPIVEAVAAGARHLVLSRITVFAWIAGDGARYADPGSEQAIEEALHDAVKGHIPPTLVDLDRFTWSASAALIAETSLRAGDGHDPGGVGASLRRR